MGTSLGKLTLDLFTPGQFSLTTSGVLSYIACLSLRVDSRVQFVRIARSGQFVSRPSPPKNRDS